MYLVRSGVSSPEIYLLLLGSDFLHQEWTTNQLVSVRESGALHVNMKRVFHRANQNKKYNLHPRLHASIEGLVLTTLRTKC